MKSKRNRFWSDNRFRLMLTLGLAVLLPAAALIYVNFHHLKSIKRDKNVGGHHPSRLPVYARHLREEDQPEDLHDDGRSEGRLSHLRTATLSADKERKLDLILSKNPWLAHVFLFDAEKGLLFRSQPQQMGDTYFREEHERMAEMFGGWFGMEGKMMVEEMHKKSRPIIWYTGHAKRAGRRGLHDDCLLRLTAALQGSRRDGRRQLRPRLPEANLLSGNARRADRPEAD